MARNFWRGMFTGGFIGGLLGKFFAPPQRKALDLDGAKKQMNSIGAEVKKNLGEVKDGLKGLYPKK